MSRRLRARIGLGLLSVAGTSAGHYLAYWLAAPDSHHREELLEATGHAGESPFVVVAVAALLATCIAALAGRSSGKAPRYGVSVVTLAVLQTVAFVGIEVAERVAAHTPLLESVREPVFLLGLVTQLIVALIGGLLLKSLHAASITVASVPPRPGYFFSLVPAPIQNVVARDVYRVGDARGPPVSS